jgi:hypothetical protein
MRWEGDAACMGRKRNAYRFFARKPEERDHLEYLGTDGRIVLKCIKKIGWEDVDWINLAQERDQWKAFLNIVMNLCVPHNNEDVLFS